MTGTGETTEADRTTAETGQEAAGQISGHPTARTGLDRVGMTGLSPATGDRLVTGRAKAAEEGVSLRLEKGREGSQAVLGRVTLE